MNELSSRLRALQDEYARRLPDKLDQLEELWQKLLYVDWRADLFALMQRMVHNLAGSGRSFGFPELSDAAAGLDRYLQQCLAESKPPSDAVRQEITTALIELRACLHTDNAELEEPLQTGASNVRGSRPLIFVVDDDHDLGTYLQLQLSLRGYQVQVFSDVDAAIAAVPDRRPAAVLMDVMFPRSYRAGIDAVSEFRAHLASRAPVLFMSARTDMTARLEALRAGGDAYFTKPLDIEGLCQKLDQLVLPAADTAHRVLVLEHDTDQAESHCEALESVGIVCRQLRNGLQLIEEIVQFRPDIVLMARHGGAWDGLELAAAVRQDAQFVFMPIVFTVQADDPELRDQALRSGVDDVIAADAPAAELVACVHERIHSAARVASRARVLSVKDPLTGTLNRRCFLEQADLAMAGAGGEQRTGLLYLAVDQVQLLRRDLGAPCFRTLIAQVSQRLRESLLADDTVAYFGNGIFTVLVRNADQASLAQRGAALLEAVAGSPLEACGQSVATTCSIGLAMQDAEVTDASALLLRAERAADQAQADGGGRVCAAPSADPGVTPVCFDDPAAAVEEAVSTRAFELVYQPILRLHGEHEEMYEALLRMHDGQGRVIPPAVFLPRLRDGNRMAELDRWVIEHAIATLAADRRTRGRTRFFIKLSAEALGNRMLLMWISNCIRNSRLIGQERIVFEAAEPDVAMHLEATEALVRGLRQLHCALVVEHFGSSDATAAILERVRPEYVKIQGDAVRDAAANEHTAERTRALVAQAAAAGAVVIVGQVEDTGTLALLWDMGVRYFQGHVVRSPGRALDFDFQHALQLAPASA